MTKNNPVSGDLIGGCFGAMLLIVVAIVAGATAVLGWGVAILR